MIDSGCVTGVFHDCLFRDEEVQNGGPDESLVVVAKGIINNIGFHKERLEGHRNEVRSFLSDLPDAFHKGRGDGMSFLNACNTRDGEQWTGEHRVMEQLFLLGMALGYVKCPLPRQLWGALPGGVPYYTVDLNSED